MTEEELKMDLDQIRKRVYELEGQVRELSRLLEMALGEHGRWRNMDRSLRVLHEVKKEGKLPW